MNRLVLASNNEGKIREFRRILTPLSIEVIPQAHLGVVEADEPHGTFVENALVKARHASVLTGLPALADDSGLCVEALDGAPGVQSARFAGEPRSDERNNDRVLELLARSENRKAHYYCVLVLLRHVDDPQPLIAEGEWHGEILRERRGTGGFGYDPLFFDPLLGRTGAELPLDEKNRVSHRGKALELLVEKLKVRCQNEACSRDAPVRARAPDTE
jgi:XTP/dITP diphosphohydrolase